MQPLALDGVACHLCLEQRRHRPPPAAYSWTLPRTYPLTVTAINRCEEAHGTQTVRVWETWPYQMYLPGAYHE